MSAAETIPFTASSTNTRRWSPTDRERMIYQWVKFDGHKQDWVAQQLNMHQSTVSRICERYERWIAHGGASQQGAPSHDERLRAQRWLTYERNEWILTSALRIAGEMERTIDSSKSNITHHTSDPSREIEVRTEHKVLDRSGIASRFLRLAHRINMDQLELLEREQLLALEPLTFDDLDIPQATADNHQGMAVGTAASHPESPAPPLTPSPIPEPVPLDQSLSRSFTPSLPQEPTTETELAAQPMHPVHNPEPSESQTTPILPTTSAKNTAPKKPIPNAYEVAPNPPEPTDPLQSIIDATLDQQLPPIRILPLQLLICPQYSQSHSTTDP